MKYEYILLVLLFFMFGPHFLKYLSFRMSRFGDKTGNTYIQAMNDKGTQGEYLIYKTLKRLQRRKGGKILANAYIPKNNGSETTEVDLMYIAKTGIYVIESKNYSGKIYGSEKDNNWIQYLGGKKFNFYNPVKQNLGHIYSLKSYLGRGVNYDAFTSVIVFSEKCELKTINITSENIRVIKRNRLMKVLKDDVKNGKVIFNDDEINKIYEAIKPLTNLSEEEKRKHEERVSLKYGGV